MSSNGTGTSVKLSSCVDRTCVLSTSTTYNVLEFKDFLQAHALFPIRRLGRATGLPQAGDNSATDVEPRHTRGPVLSFFRGIPGLSRKLDALIRFSAPLLLTPPTLTAMSRSVRAPHSLPCSSTIHYAALHKTFFWEILEAVCCSPITGTSWNVWKRRVNNLFNSS
jgi:hypothetical protein